MSRHELALQKRIVAAIIERGGLARICAQTPYTVVGDPDIYGSYSGRMFQFEVKIGKEQPTAIQKRRMKEWIRVGAHVAVVRSVKEAVEELSWV